MKYLDLNSKSDFQATNCPQLDFPKPPTVPTFFELVEKAPISSEAPKPKGLFETLLGGHAEALYVDAEEFPDKYPEETHRLLVELINSPKKFDELSLTEQILLDQAVIDFAAPPPKKPTPPMIKAASEEAEEDEPDLELDGTPESSLTPFWWAGRGDH